MRCHALKLGGTAVVDTGGHGRVVRGRTSQVVRGRTSKGGGLGLEGWVPRILVGTHKGKMAALARTVRWLLRGGSRGGGWPVGVPDGVDATAAAAAVAAAASHSACATSASPLLGSFARARPGCMSSPSCHATTVAVGRVGVPILALVSKHRHASGKRQDSESRPADVAQQQAGKEIRPHLLDPRP